MVVLGPGDGGSSDDDDDDDTYSVTYTDDSDPDTSGGVDLDTGFSGSNDGYDGSSGNSDPTSDDDGSDDSYTGSDSNSSGGDSIVEPTGEGGGVNLEAGFPGTDGSGVQDEAAWSDSSNPNATEGTVNDTTAGVPGVTNSPSNTPGQEMAMDWGKYALIGAAIVGGIMVLD